MFVVVYRGLFSLVDELSSTNVLLWSSNLLLCLECAWDVVLLLLYPLIESMLSLSCQVASCMYVLLLVLCPVASPLILVDLFVWMLVLLLLALVVWSQAWLWTMFLLSMVVHPMFFLPVLAEDCAVVPQSPLLFHLSFVLLFSVVNPNVVVVCHPLGSCWSHRDWWDCCLNTLLCFCYVQSCVDWCSCCLHSQVV